MCINCSITVIRFSPQLAWPVYRLIKSDRRIMTQTNTRTPLYPPPNTHTKAGIEKTSSTAKQIHKNVCMCVSVCMFVATTSINKNCLYSFSLPLSLLRSHSMLFSPFKRCTRPKTGSIAWFSVCTICGASQHSGIFPPFSSPPLRSRFWCVLCVRFFVCPLLSCAARFRHYVALVDCGSAALRGGVTANITCSAFFAHAPSPPVDVPVAPLTQLLPNWRRHCRRRQGRLLPSYTAFIFSCFGFFPSFALA